MSPHYLIKRKFHSLFFFFFLFFFYVHTTYKKNPYCYILYKLNIRGVSFNVRKYTLRNIISFVRNNLQDVRLYNSKKLLAVMLDLLSLLPLSDSPICSFFLLLLLLLLFLLYPPIHITSPSPSPSPFIFLFLCITTLKNVYKDTYNHLPISKDINVVACFSATTDI